MKKSQMVELLKEFVLSVNASYSCEEASVVALQWFNQLESTGIAPPIAKITHTRDFGDGMVFSFVNEERVWENE